jgi:hypothetical protein
VPTYDGPATLVADDGGVLGEVEASLVSPDADDGAVEPWFGTVKGEFDAFDLMDGTPSLRLPDGRASTFRLSRTDLVVPRMGVDVVGTAPPPF